MFMKFISTAISIKDGICIPRINLKDAIAVPTTISFNKNPLLEFDGKVKEIGKDGKIC